jgi:hypothetical protein
MQFDQLKRRGSMTLGGATTWPLGAQAQQPGRMGRIGVVESSPEVKASLTAFQERLQQPGWTQARSVGIDYCSANGDQEPRKPTRANC